MNKTPQELIPDEAIERVHANANFGSMPKRDVVKETVLKCAFEYSAGYTALQICQEHGLLKKDDKLTVFGFKYLRSSWDLVEFLERNPS